jgi:hypothetical protein
MAGQVIGALARRHRRGHPVRVTGPGAAAGGIAGPRVKPRGPLAATDLLMAGLAPPLLTLAFSRSVALIATAEAVSGFTMIMGNSVWFTAIQTLSPGKIRRRSGSPFVAAWSTVMGSRSKLDRLFDYQPSSSASFFPFSLRPSGGGGILRSCESGDTTCKTWSSRPRRC